MKLKNITYILMVLLSILALQSFSQCDPLTPVECPDPENNGEVCPDSLAMAFLSQFYSQSATIKPPLSYFLPPDSTQIDLHHVKLMEVGNLPGGLTWQSNAADSVFNAGEYYCVLMEGTPDSAGEYPLRITVDVYVLVFGVPVRVASVTDSTSLTITVIDDSGIDDKTESPFSSLKNIPNPFQSETTITFFSEKSGAGIFEVFSSMGKRIHSENIQTKKGDNLLNFNGQQLSPGMYFYLVRMDGFKTSGIMIRSDR